MPSLATPLFREAFSRIEELQISSTLTTWPKATQLVSCMPSLRLVEIGYNRLDSLAGLDTEQTSAEHPTLQVINLDGNFLGNWADICVALKPFTG